MDLVDAVPLSAEDEAILRLESDTVVGHTCKVVRVARDLPDVDALRDRVASRLASVPELTRRLVRTDAGLLWGPDEEFDLARHVGAPAPEAAPGTGLPDAVAGLFAQRLDRAHPLWRLDVVGGEDGGGALVWRVHHALADGTTMMRFARALLWDPAPAAEDAGRGTRQHRDAPGDDARRRRHLAGFFHREFARSLAVSPFDGQIGPRREVAFASTGLDDLRRVAKDLAGATLNDAVLTTVAGGLRRWIEVHHGRLGVLRVKVPVSLHHEGADAGNRDSFFNVGVPLDEPDPVPRLRATREATSERKTADDAATMDRLLRTLRERLERPGAAASGERAGRSGDRAVLDRRDRRAPRPAGRGDLAGRPAVLRPVRRPGHRRRRADHRRRHRGRVPRPRRRGLTRGQRGHEEGPRCQSGR